MAKKFEIIQQSLIVSDTLTSEILLDVPKHLYYYRAEFLDKNQIKIVPLNFIKNLMDGPKVYSLSESVDKTNTPFTVESFTLFARTFLGIQSSSVESAKVELAKNDLGYDAWGKPKVTIDSSLFYGMFTYNVPVTVWFETINGLVNNTGVFNNSSSLNGKLNLRSGAGASDVVYLRTFRNPRHEPNRGHIFSTSVFLPSPTALGIRRWGYYTAESGSFFELTSVGLYGVIRTTLLGVTSDNRFLIDTTGIDLSKGNIYDIQMQWRGVGDYNFIINKKIALTVELLGTETELSMYNPANPIAFECENTGAEVVLQSGCVDITSEGGKDNNKHYGSISTSNISGQVAITGFNIPVIAMKSLGTVNGLINTRDTLFLLVNAYADQRALVRIWQTRDLTAITENDQTWKNFGDGNLQYIEYDNPDVTIPMTFDTAKAELIFGSRIDRDQAYTTSALFENKTSIYMHPNDMYIITIHRETGQVCNVGASVEFAEEI